MTDGLKAQRGGRYYLLFFYGMKGVFQSSVFSRYSRSTSHLVGCMVSLFEELINSEMLHTISDCFDPKMRL